MKKFASSVPTQRSDLIVFASRLVGENFPFSPISTGLRMVKSGASFVGVYALSFCQEKRLDPMK